MTKVVRSKREELLAIAAAAVAGGLEDEGEEVCARRGVERDDGDMRWRSRRCCRLAASFASWTSRASFIRYSACAAAADRSLTASASRHRSAIVAASSIASVSRCASCLASSEMDPGMRCSPRS